MQTTLRGRRVEYEENGYGIPLVLIHGYPLNRTMWEPQVQGLADVAHVIAPDLRGFGNSEMVSETTMESYADDIHELLGALAVNEPAVFCGLSIGGYIAFAYYRKYPAEVRGLILSNTRAGADSPEGKAGRDRSAALAEEKGSAAIAEAMLPKLLSPKSYENNPELVDRLKRMIISSSVDGIVGALMAMKERPDSTSLLAEIEKPALIITGVDDQLIPPSESELMAKGIKNARLVILPDAGHLSNFEQPELFNQAVRDFLKSLP